jgi:hypothetical protein
MSNYKGIDDLLAAGKQPRRLKGSEVEAHFRAIREQFHGGSPATAPDEVPTVIHPPRHQVPPFPVDVFPERVAHFVRRVATAMGCPVDFPGVGALVVSSAAIGAARCLRVKDGWDEKPGLYAVIVSPPGTAKTPALKKVMKPVYDEQDRLYQEYLAARAGFKEDTAEYRAALKNHEDDAPLPEPPAEPAPLRHLYANDTTVEALASNLHDNPKGLLVFRDELRAWVRSLDMYRSKGTDRQFFLSAWSGESVKVDRKGHKGPPLIISHPFLSILGGIQPDLLSELEAEGGQEDGFIHRILFSYPPETGITGWIKDGVTEQDEESWKLVVSRLHNLQPLKLDGSSEQPRPLLFSAEGLAAFAAWYDRVGEQVREEHFPREMVGPCSKLRSYCARFALVIHLLRVACDEAGTTQDEGRVDEMDVARAIMLFDYFLAHYRQVACRLQETSEDRQVEALRNWMERKQLTSCSAREVHRANVAGIKTTSEAEKLLALAVDRGLGGWEEPASSQHRAGRKKSSVRFALHGPAPVEESRPLPAPTAARVA